MFFSMIYVFRFSDWWRFYSKIIGLVVHHAVHVVQLLHHEFCCVIKKKKEVKIMWTYGFNRTIYQCLRTSQLIVGLFLKVRKLLKMILFLPELTVALYSGALICHTLHQLENKVWNILTHFDPFWAQVSQFSAFC